MHIADVSHYVKEGDIIDKEAQRRATSIYLVDRTIPMLPERLCNFICSLRPNEEKLCYSCVFTLDGEANVLDYRIVHTVIRSDRRYCYAEVQQLLEDNGVVDGTGEPAPAPGKEGYKGENALQLIMLDALAKRLRQKRFRHGSINFDTEELHFDIDEKGKPTRCYFKRSKDANKLIEEFMLLANRTVAESVACPGKGKKPKTLPYRIHDDPDPQKLENLRELTAKLGYKMKSTSTKGATARALNKLMEFGTLAARGVIRDVGRVMDLPYAYVDSIAKMIPQELGITIDKALQMNPELRKLYESDETVTHLIDMAKRLEGLPRHCSMHAAGVVICQKPVEEYVPLSRAADGTITTQFIMTTLEELGLLKMDFLGLRTLTVIQNAVQLARKKQPDLQIDKIDYNDKAVLDYIGTGKTEGIFQLESGGMKNFMKELQPHSLEDVIAGISLYRPGPMDFIPQYIRGKNDRSSITYDCPQLEPILAPTYGCIVYQEQVMQIVRDLAGYTLGRSDLLRRAMSKKKAAVMEKERNTFV